MRTNKTVLYNIGVLIKPGGTQHNLIQGGFHPEVQPLILLLFFTEKVPLSYTILSYLYFKFYSYDHGIKYFLF